MTQVPGWSDGLYLFFLVFLPLPASCFSELVIFRDCFIFFASVGTFSGSFYFIFMYLILGQLVTTKIRFFALKSKKEKVLGRGYNGF